MHPQYSGADDGTAVTKMDYVQMDITNSEEVTETIKKVNPDVVVHCAAWTAVDLAEEKENKEKVMAINVGGTENIAWVCKELDCKMVYISTDYVFDGYGTRPRRRLQGLCTNLMYMVNQNLWVKRLLA